MMRREDRFARSAAICQRLSPRRKLGARAELLAGMLLRLLPPNP